MDDTQALREQAAAAQAALAAAEAKAHAANLPVLQAAKATLQRLAASDDMKAIAAAIGQLSPDAPERITLQRLIDMVAQTTTNVGYGIRNAAMAIADAQTSAQG